LFIELPHTLLGKATTIQPMGKYDTMATSVLPVR
jgi:hypothetical protein